VEAATIAEVNSSFEPRFGEKKTFFGQTYFGEISAATQTIHMRKVLRRINIDLHPMPM
jgi:hypothetical protein